MRKTLLTFLLLVAFACGPPSVENPSRKENRFPGGVNVPVVFLVNEWAGKPKILASGWLVEGSSGVIFSAKHFTDEFMGNTIELGGSECKAFIAGKVYDCVVLRVPPLRDVVVMKLKGSFDPNQLPKPYKIATEKVKVGEKLFIQGFHPHPRWVSESNKKEGFHDKFVPIMKFFYEFRLVDPLAQREIVFDSLESKVIITNEHIRINSGHNDPLGDVKYKANEYIKVKTVRNHKFSFGGLSGGVAIRINKNGDKEAVGIVTAEEAVRWDYDKKGKLIDKKIRVSVAELILITPIESVKELYEYARTLR